MENRPSKLLICVTFHFNPNRLPLLSGIASRFSELADVVDVCIVTNLGQEGHEAIKAALSPRSYTLSIVSPALLGHPYLLAWCHKAIFRQSLEDHHKNYSHFLYLEDDILITQANMSYWMEARERLKPHRLVPSFMRYELHPKDQTLISTDQVSPLHLNETACIVFPGIGYLYMNMRNPYQGMTLYDRALLQEHFAHPHASGPDYLPTLWWLIREKATLGVTYQDIPYGFTSRTVIGYWMDKKVIDERCLIHHTPNNYASDPNSPYGKIRVEDVVKVGRLAMSTRSRHRNDDGSCYRLPRAPMKEYLQSAAKKAKAYIIRK